MMKVASTIIFCLFLSFSSICFADDIAIIANKNYPANKISILTLREIYLGEKLMEGDVRIKPFINKEHKLKTFFLEKVLGLNEDKFNAYWIKKVFQEGGTPPATKKSSEDLIEAVKEEKGGIGYVWKKEAKGEDIKILLILKIEDKGPGGHYEH